MKDSEFQRETTHESILEAIINKFIHRTMS